MSLSDEVAALTEPVEGNAIPSPRAREKGSPWSPGVEMDGNTGELRTRPSEKPTTDWDAHLTDWGFDPKRYEVVEPIRMSTWEAQIKGGDIRKMWAYRARIVTRHGALTSLSDSEIERLAKDVRKATPRARPAVGGDACLVIPLADFQVAKPDGDGLDGTVRRLLAMPATIERRLWELRRMGRPIGSVAFIGMGDLVEGCDGFYAQQSFGVELDRRDQVKLVRRVLRDLIIKIAPLVTDMQITCVGGNHGENRKDGKSFTTFNDNDDVAVFEQVAEIMAMNPDAYGHVRFAIPRGELSHALDMGGQRVGFAHGHQLPNGRDAAREWWKNQRFGRQPVGDADLLITAHLHSLRVEDYGNATWMRCPTMDGGSTWWTNRTGEGSRPGVLSFVTAPDRLWSDLQVLGG